MVVLTTAGFEDAAVAGVVLVDPGPDAVLPPPPHAESAATAPTDMLNAVIHLMADSFPWFFLDTTAASPPFIVQHLLDVSFLLVAQSGQARPYGRHTDPELVCEVVLVVRPLQRFGQRSERYEPARG